MRFSILVPVYNMERYLKDCFESIRAQTYKDYEVIIVNNGSTDQSGYLCDRFAEEHSNVRVFHQENQGLLMSRRRGFKESRGEYCVVLDSDDFIRNDMLQILNECIEQHNPDLILLDALRYCEGEIFPHKPSYETKPKLYDNTNKKELYEKFLKREISNTLWSKVIKRSIIDVDEDYSHYVDVSINEDFLQTMPLFTNAERIFYLREALYYYRVNPKSITKTYSEASLRSLKQVNQILDQYILIWDVQKGLTLGGYRYLVDVYDIFLSAMMTHDKCVIKNARETFVNDKYYAEKYRIADKKMLKIWKRFVLFCLYHDLKILLWMYEKFFLPTIIYIKNVKNNR